MANRIDGNVYILDAAGVLPWGNQRCISAFGFLSLDTSSKISLISGSGNIVYQQNFITMGLSASALTINPAFVMTPFASPVWFDQLTVQTLTAGTGYIYFT